MQACDPDVQIAAAKLLPGVVGEPTPEQIQSAAEQLAQQAEHEVRLDRALVYLVHDEHAVSGERRRAARAELLEQHARRHEEQLGGAEGLILEADLDAHLLTAKLDAHRLSDAPRDRGGSNAARLSDSDAAVGASSGVVFEQLEKVDRKHSRLAAAGLALNDGHVVLAHGLAHGTELLR